MNKEDRSYGTWHLARSYFYLKKIDKYNRELVWVYVDNELLENKTEREKLIDKIEVLDKVKS